MVERGVSENIHRVYPDIPFSQNEKMSILSMVYYPCFYWCAGLVCTLEDYNCDLCLHYMKWRSRADKYNTIQRHCLPAFAIMDVEESNIGINDPDADFDFLLIVARCIINNNLVLMQYLWHRHRQQHHFRTALASFGFAGSMNAWSEYS